MGSELVTVLPPPGESGAGDNSSSALKSYTDFFCEQLPFYLAIGMTYSQFWDEDVWLVKYYREADEIKKKRTNQELWLQGFYVYNAIGSLAPVLHAFARAGTEPIPYMSEPVPLTEQEMKEREEREDKARMEEQIEKMRRAMIRINQTKQR